MKILFLPVAASLLLFAGGCHKEPAGPFTLGIDLQSAFNHDYVTVQLDGAPVYQDTATTNEALGLAASIGRSQQVKGTHTIVITINNTVSKTFSVNLDKDEYYGLGYDPKTAQCILSSSAQPFLYF